MSNQTTEGSVSNQRLSRLIEQTASRTKFGLGGFWDDVHIALRELQRLRSSGGARVDPALILDLRDWQRVCESDHRAWDAARLGRAIEAIEGRPPEPSAEPAAWRLRNSGFRYQPHYAYFPTKDAAEKARDLFNMSCDDASLIELTPLYTKPASIAPEPQDQLYTKTDVEALCAIAVAGVTARMEAGSALMAAERDQYKRERDEARAAEPGEQSMPCLSCGEDGRKHTIHQDTRGHLYLRCPSETKRTTAPACGYCGDLRTVPNNSPGAPDLPCPSCSVPTKGGGE